MIRHLILGAAFIALSGCDQFSSPTPEEVPSPPQGWANEGAAAAAAADAMAPADAPETQLPSPTFRPLDAPNDDDVERLVKSKLSQNDVKEICGFIVDRDWSYGSIESVKIVDRGEKIDSQFPFKISVDVLCNARTPFSKNLVMTIRVFKDDFGELDLKAVKHSLQY